MFNCTLRNSTLEHLKFEKTILLMKYFTTRIIAITGNLIWIVDILHFGHFFNDKPTWYIAICLQTVCNKFEQNII